MFDADDSMLSDNIWHSDGSCTVVKRRLTRAEPLDALWEEGYAVYTHVRIPKYTEPFRLCEACDEVVILDRPDPCWGELPGVMFACCGHGEKKGAYIAFDNGVTVRLDGGLRVERAW